MEALHFVHLGSPEQSFDDTQIVSWKFINFNIWVRSNTETGCERVPIKKFQFSSTSRGHLIELLSILTNVKSFIEYTQT